MRSVAGCRVAAFTARFRKACSRLQDEPRSLIEKIVMRPDDFPYEAWSRAHPEKPRGTLSKSEIKGAIGAHSADVRSCYEDALAGWPDLEGRLVVRFGIHPSGSVVAVAIVSNGMGVDPVGCCIVEAIRTWRFRPPDGGGPVIVTYPFVLERQP